MEDNFSVELLYREQLLLKNTSEWLLLTLDASEKQKDSKECKYKNPYFS